MSDHFIDSAVSGVIGKWVVGTVRTALLGGVGSLLVMLNQHSTEIAVMKTNQVTTAEAIGDLRRTLEKHDEFVDRQIGHVVNVEDEQAKELAAIRQAQQDYIESHGLRRP